MKTGIRGLLVADEEGTQHVYAILEPASNYYGVMTKAEWMPALVGQSL